MGDWYEDGYIVKQSTEKAMAWYEKAAANDYLPALRRLGDVWYNGELGHEPDKAKALYYYKRGAELGDWHCADMLNKF